MKVISFISLISFGLVFFLISLLNDPGDELFGFLSGLGQQFKRNHVEHLNRLV